MTARVSELTSCAHCGKLLKPGNLCVQLTFCSQSDMDRFLENLKERG